MTSIKMPAAYLIAGGAVLAALVWVATRGNGRQVGNAIGGAAVDLADGVISGAVVGTGQLVGVPATNMTQCERDKAAGDTWAASFSCPAADWLRYVWS